jgi:hypothetical protein
LLHHHLPSLPLTPDWESLHCLIFSKFHHLTLNLFSDHKWVARSCHSPQMRIPEIQMTCFKATTIALMILSWKSGIVNS